MKNLLNFILMLALLAALIILGSLGGCTTVSTDNPAWEYPKENLQ